MGRDLIDGMLKHEREELRACAARCLYLMNDRSGKEIFLKSLEHGTMETKRICLQFFSKIKDGFIAQAFLNSALNEAQTDLCLELADQADEIPETDPIKSAVKRELGSEDPHRRWMAIRICGKWNSSWSHNILKHECPAEPDRALRRLIKKYLQEKNQ